MLRLRGVLVLCSVGFGFLPHYHALSWSVALHNTPERSLKVSIWLKLNPMRSQASAALVGPVEREHLLVTCAGPLRNVTVVHTRA